MDEKILPSASGWYSIFIPTTAPPLCIVFVDFIFLLCSLLTFRKSYKSWAFAFSIPIFFKSFLASILLSLELWACFRTPCVKSSISSHSIIPLSFESTFEKICWSFLSLKSDCFTPALSISISTLSFLPNLPSFKSLIVFSDIKFTYQFSIGTNI